MENEETGCRSCGTRGGKDEGEDAGYKEEHGDRTERNKMRLTLACTARRRIDVLLIKPRRGKVTLEEDVRARKDRMKRTTKGRGKEDEGSFRRWLMSAARRDNTSRDGIKSNIYSRIRVKVRCLSFVSFRLEYRSNVKTFQRTSNGAMLEFILWKLTESLVND